MTGGDTKTVSMELPMDVYDRLWDMKNEQHPESGEAIDHAEAMKRLIDRWEGHRRERPPVLYGVKARIKAPHGKVYVGINEDHAGDPFEVFISTGSSGGFTNAFCESLAKTISNALRAGVEPEVIADDLMGIRGPDVSNDAGDRIYSIPDAVGVVLKRYLTGRLDPPQPVRGTGESDLGVTD